MKENKDQEMLKKGTLGAISDTELSGVVGGISAEKLDYFSNNFEEELLIASCTNDMAKLEKLGKKMSTEFSKKEYTDLMNVLYASIVGIKSLSNDTPEEKFLVSVLTTEWNCMNKMKDKIYK